MVLFKKKKPVIEEKNKHQRVQTAEGWRREASQKYKKEIKLIVPMTQDMPKR
jgi:hypothetical protein